MMSHWPSWTLLSALLALGIAGCECSPPSCRAEQMDGGLPCPSNEMPVCQARACAVIAAVGTQCDVDPCLSTNPRVCGTGFTCDDVNHVCRAAPQFFGGCNPATGPDACAWPYVCSPFQDEDHPTCPAEPSNFPSDLGGICTLGAQAGQACVRSYTDPGPGCQRCEPGLQCVSGTCVQTCRDNLDCPCDQSCADGLCSPAECVVGAACETTASECGECLDTVTGPHCIPVDGERDPSGQCVLGETPPACDPAVCEVGEVSICQDRRCAEVATPTLMATPESACTVFPCEAPNAPRICPFPTTCIWDASPECPLGVNCPPTAPGHCIERSEAPPTELSSCSARSENNLIGYQCTFPLVCRGFDGEASEGAADGCPARGAIPSGNPSVCVRGQVRGEPCDASYGDRVRACMRCEPGLSCLDGVCQMPTTGDCPCGEGRNGEFCGPLCAIPGTTCTAVSGMCGFCVANPLGGTTCDSGNALSEGCAGNVGVDDDCDGTVDEETPDPTCDGLDDDCDGTADEDWDAFRELTPAAVFVPGCGDVPPHLECQGAAGIARIATPGLDYLPLTTT